MEPSCPLCGEQCKTAQHVRQHLHVHHRKSALKSYRALWHSLHAGEASVGRTDLLDTPEALLGGHAGNVRLRRPPTNHDGLAKYTVDLDFDVMRDGRVKDVRVVESNAPKDLQMKIVRDFKHTRYRPRFDAGEPVDTTDLYQRQNFYKPRPVTATLAAK